MFSILLEQIPSSWRIELYLGRRRRPNEAAAAGGVAVALMEGEAGGDPRDHHCEVAQDGEAREYTAPTISVSHNTYVFPSL